MFIFQDGSTLSQKRLVSSLRQVLSNVGVSTAQYCGHSFHIGAATMAAKLGVPNSLIKKMRIVRVYALHSHSAAAAGRHLIVAIAEGQSITYFC